MDEKVINQIYKRFHIIDDIKHVLLFQLSTLNEIQNQTSFLQMDLNENRFYYSHFDLEEKQDQLHNLDTQLYSFATRALDNIERLIIETQYLIDSCLSLEDKSQVDELLYSRFMPLIQQISNFETLFLSKNNLIQELLMKTKLFASNLQKIMEFEIQNEVKMF
jgi:hypothetical protein